MAKYYQDSRYTKMYYKVDAESITRVANWGYELEIRKNEISTGSIMRSDHDEFRVEIAEKEFMDAYNSVLEQIFI